MFEGVATSAAQLVAIIFSTVIFSIMAYGALELRALRQKTKTQK